VRRRLRRPCHTKERPTSHASTGHARVCGGHRRVRSQHGVVLGWVQRVQVAVAPPYPSCNVFLLSLRRRSRDGEQRRPMNSASPHMTAGAAGTLPRKNKQPQNCGARWRGRGRGGSNATRPHSNGTGLTLCAQHSGSWYTEAGGGRREKDRLLTRLSLGVSERVDNMQRLRKHAQTGHPGAHRKEPTPAARRPRPRRARSAGSSPRPPPSRAGRRYTASRR